jgi:hypothetical protein
MGRYTFAGRIGDFGFSTDETRSCIFTSDSLCMLTQVAPRKVLLLFHCIAVVVGGSEALSCFTAKLSRPDASLRLSAFRVLPFR